MAIFKITSFMKRAYERYIAAGLTPAGACGLMGNQYAESAGFLANRVEFLLLNRLRQDGKIYTDKSYTADVDSGKITRAEFLRPRGLQYGFGLSQWTSPGRKAGLYDLAKKRGVSIGDETLAIDYTIMELEKSYPSVLAVLKKTKSVKEASDCVLIKYESPADCGSSVKNSRADCGQQFYDEFARPPVTAEDILKVMRGWVGMSRAKGTHKPIIDLYNSHRPLARGYAVTYRDAYCDATVSAAFIKCNAVGLIGGTECGVEEHINLFKKAGIWQEDGTIIPEPGYIICYNWDRAIQPNSGYADHIGIVESIDKAKKTIVAIEGNMDGGVVGRRQIPVGWGYIRGYAAPKYASKPQQEQERPAESAPSGGLSFAPKWVGQVTADLLNVRSWAGTKYANIKSWPQLGRENKVDVCDTVKAADGVDWYFVRIAGKIFGFVSSKFIKKV